MRYSTCLIVSTLFLVQPALAGSGNNVLEVRSDTQRTGTFIRQSLLGARVAADKDYADLSAADKAWVRADFAPMAESDEPPYPVGGVKALTAGIVQAQVKMRLQGHLRLVAKVEADGSVSRVDAIATPDEQMGKGVAAMVMLQKFKPALCKGQPCSMDFPVNVRLSIN